MGSQFLKLFVGVGIPRTPESESKAHRTDVEMKWRMDRRGMECGDGKRNKGRGEDQGSLRRHARGKDALAFQFTVA